MKNKKTLQQLSIAITSLLLAVGHQNCDGGLSAIQSSSLNLPSFEGANLQGDSSDKSPQSDMAASNEKVEAARKAVVATYLELLKREPSSSELSSAVAVLLSGVSPVAYAEQIKLLPEYRQLQAVNQPNPTPMPTPPPPVLTSEVAAQRFVGGIISALLMRPASASESMVASNETCFDVGNRIANMDGVSALESVRDNFIYRVYFAFLGRAPGADFQRELQLLQEGRPGWDMIRSIVKGAEFHARCAANGLPR